MKIAILGAGAYGTALGGVLADKGYDIDYYDSKLEREQLSSVVAVAKYVVLCAPSATTPYILPHLPKEQPLIVATKGILTDKPFREFRDWMVLSGPGYADDIKNARPTHLTATDPRIVELFSTNFLSFDTTTDRLGVLMCGALKNVYAIGAGYDNLRSGTKAHEQYLQSAAAEMRAILQANHADPATVDLSCGIGDLRITCYHPSRNYAYGVELGQSSMASPSGTVEGLATIRRLRRHEIDLPDDLPLVHRILLVTP